MALRLRVAVPPPLFLPAVLPPPTITTTTQASSSSPSSDIDQLEKLQVLGKGGEGTVYKVRHKFTGAVYALKVASSSLNNNHSHNVHDVFREIEILESLDSPYVVGFHGVFKESLGNVAILLDFMDLGSLETILKNIKNADTYMSEAMIAHIARQVLMGLDYLHNTKKIVHCDIKPSNLLVNQALQVKIADFGVSRKVSAIGVNDRPHLVGTVAYMSPERFDSSCCLNVGADRSLDYVYAGDIWSLGLTLMEMYTGYQPFCPPGREFMSEFDLIADICYQDSPTLPKHASADFQDFIRCCLHKDTAERWTATRLLSHPFLINNSLNLVAHNNKTGFN